jgi:hypothetical protein
MLVAPVLGIVLSVVGLVWSVATAPVSAPTWTVGFAVQIIINLVGVVTVRAARNELLGLSDWKNWYRVLYAPLGMGAVIGTVVVLAWLNGSLTWPWIGDGLVGVGPLMAIAVAPIMVLDCVLVVLGRAGSA